MPIETDIPMEIDTYRKKILFGLTGRQLLCGVAAAALSIGIYFLCTRQLGLSTDFTGWLIMAVAAPLLAMGFLRPQGVAFEEFLHLQLRQYTWPSRLPYEAETAHICQKKIKKESNRGDTVDNHGCAEKADKAGATGECTLRYIANTRKRRDHRRAARRCIRAALREARASRRRAKREARCKRTEEHG